MTSTTPKVINVQPQPHVKKTSGGSDQTTVANQKHDNVIVKEIFPSGVQINKATTGYFSPSTILTRYVGSPSCIDLPLPITCCKIPRPRWHVYLTSTDIHLVQKNCFNSIITHKRVAFNNIVKIQALTPGVLYSGFCSLGSVISNRTPTIYVMELEPHSIDLEFPFSCCSLPTVVTIYCLEDESEFIEAVKQRITQN